MSCVGWREEEDEKSSRVQLGLAADGLSGCFDGDPDGYLKYTRDDQVRVPVGRDCSGVSHRVIYAK